MTKHRKTHTRLTDAHSTMITEAKVLVPRLIKIDGATKVSLGRITPYGRATNANIKVLALNGGYRLTIRGADGIQDVMVYGNVTEQEITTVITKSKYKVAHNDTQNKQLGQDQ